MGIMKRRTPSRTDDTPARWIPYAAGVVAVVISAVIWRSLVTYQDTQMRQNIRAAAIVMVVDLSRHINGVVTALEQLAVQQEPFDARTSAWASRHSFVLALPGGPWAVESIGPDFRMRDRAVGRKEGRQTLFDQTAEFDAAQVRVLESALASGKAATTEPFVAAGGHTAFRIIVPVVVSGQVDGFVSGLFLADEMLSEVLVSESLQYAIEVHASGAEVYRSTEPAPLPLRWREVHMLDFPGGVSWELEVRPSAALVAAIVTPLPEMVFGTSLLLSLLLAMTLHFAATRRARALKLSNAMLSDEVAERRRAEEQLRELTGELEARVHTRTEELAGANEELQRQNELRRRIQVILTRSNNDLKRLAAFVSHELRQPLATMQIWVDLLNSVYGETLGEKGRGYVAKLRTSVARITGLLEGQLRLARTTYTELAVTDRVDVARLIREIVVDFQSQLLPIGGHVEVEDVPALRADPTQMRQLFRNLIENAIKYRRNDVPLIVRITGKARHTDENSEPQCEIRVEDNGQGFSVEDADNIFEIFHRVRPEAGDGLGVGLAICQSIVEHHGGSIRAEGKPSEGSTFVIRLPIERCEEPSQSERPQ
jgi:signal transduction histidine kinase